MVNMQKRIITPGLLHDEQGHLIETGYATELIRTYDRKTRGGEAHADQGLGIRDLSSALSLQMALCNCCGVLVFLFWGLLKNG